MHLMSCGDRAPLHKLKYPRPLWPHVRRLDQLAPVLVPCSRSILANPCHAQVVPIVLPIRFVLSTNRHGDDRYTQRREKEIGDDEQGVGN